MTKFTQLRQRILGASLYGAFMLIAYLWNSYTFLGGVFLILLYTLYETNRITCRFSKRCTNMVIVYSATLLLTGFMLFSTLSLSFQTIMLALIWLGVIHHSLLVILVFSRSFRHYSKLPDFLITMLYIGLSFGALYAYSIAFFEYEKWRVIIILLCVWGADIGAYFTGSMFGKLKLAPHVSPNKTWEGLLGGLVIATFLGYLLSSWILLTPPEGALLGAIIAISSVFGDLVESKLKRTVEVKDSGRLLPGHGGILDRIDGYIYTQPFVAIIFTYFI